MELCYLDYEIIIQDIQDEYSSESCHNDLSKKSICLNGNVQYSPDVKSLMFYDTNNNFEFTIPLMLITIKPDFLNQNKIVFDYQKNKTIYQIHIFNNKKETLGEKTLNLLLQVVYKYQLKKTKKDSQTIKEKYIIGNPKQYQLEMLEKAKKNNIIVFLETGLGKTYIAILMIKTLFDEPFQANRLNNLSYIKKSKKKVLCLFKTVSLLLQQAKVIKHNTTLKILKLYGNSENSRLYLHSQFTKILNKNDIICATPETIYRYFTFGYLTVDDLELIVIDECHHARENDYYNLILKQFIFSNNANKKKIKILGLTASPCVEKVMKEDDIYESIVSLCNNLHSQLACPSNIINNQSTCYHEQLNFNTSILNLSINKIASQQKEITFLKLQETEFNKIDEIKCFIFNQLLLPLLDWYFTIKLKNDITHQEKQIADSIMNKNNNEPFKAPVIKGKDKKSLKCNINIYILSHYLSLKSDENKLEEKFLGIYTKGDITELISYLTYFKTNKTSSCFTWITADSIQKLISKLSLYEIRDENDKINLSFEIKDFIKENKVDLMLKELKKYTKTINLIIKYLDIESIYDFTVTSFKEIQTVFFQLSKNLSILSDTNNISYFDYFSLLLTPIRKLVFINQYTSSYLSSLIQFLTDKNHSNDKTILFVDQRNICNAFDRKINLVLGKTGLSSRQVIGISSSKSNVTFTEKELKENLEYFRTNNQCKLLIATNVVEEGIDVPQCNNIICLSEIKTIKEYIQKTGRARMEQSRFILFSNEADEQLKIQNLKQIEMSLKVMKNIIQNKNIMPISINESFIKNYDYFETIKGARVYLSYAQKIIDEFISKLFNDGYTFVHAEGKVEETISINKNYKEKVEKMFYRPYLSLPSVLENNFSKVYDNNSSFQFTTKELAKAYFNQYKPHYYLKAIKILHQHFYLDDFLQFNKNYDDLISIENNFLKCECEKRISIKPSLFSQIQTDEIEFTVHLLLFQPNYFDISYNEKNSRYICLLSDKPLALVNFDLFIPSNLLLKLYYLNSHFSANDNENSNKTGELPNWFKKKPKIPYTIFAKMNIAMHKYFPIKVSKNNMDLINFFFTYSLFLSTDSEMFFYHSLYANKFAFCEKLFNHQEIKEQLFFIFQHYDNNYLKLKQHLKDYSTSQLQYEKHLVKFSLIKHNLDTDKYEIDFDFIIKCYKCVLKEIENYFKFLKRCLQTEDERQKLLVNPTYICEKEEALEKEINNDESFQEPNIGTICRNMFNFSKMIIMMYGSTDIRGTTKHLKFKQFTYQQYFVYNYGILTRSNKDYKKCLLLDYNMKVMRYKINIKNLGEVKKKFNHILYTKKYHFFPNEILQQVKFATIDQLHLFTLFPVILFKVQNSLVYYYYTYLLMNKFTKTFNRLPTINIKLISSGLNSKSTMELDNYERLEFLGDAILKFVSSIEMFMKYPNANRDLLFSKRRSIENNKNLFQKGKEKELYQYLFTSPITLKRVIIPGFTHDESLIFDISYNRSFTKNCYLHKRKVLQDANDKINNQNDILFCNEEDLNNNQSNNPKEYLISKEENEMENEKKNEKTTIEIDYNNNAEEIVCPDISLPVTREIIEEVVNEKIEIINSKQFRFIYSKNLADLVESLIGFVFHASLDNQYSIDEAINSSSIFLMEICILETNFLTNLTNNWKVTLKDLKNNQCKFSSEQQNNYMRLILDNEKYKFNNNELLYQAMTHPSYLTDEKKAGNWNYVNKSYQRLSFLGEATLFLYVSYFVYSNNIHENESTLHKMRICGINHHIISLIAIDELKLDDCLLKSGGDLNNDILNYKMKLKHIRSSQENQYKITNEALLDDNFVVVLCELFYSYIGAILLDSKSVKTTFKILEKILLEYLKNNATKDTYTEHPKVTILEEFNKKRHYFKRIRENGGNRLMMKFGHKKEDKFRKQKLYDYQLIIDKFVIYEESIAYNRSTIKMAQEKAKNVFLEICKEIDRREKLRLHLSKFDLENILKYLGINYKTLN